MLERERENLARGRKRKINDTTGSENDGAAAFEEIDGGFLGRVVEMMEWQVAGHAKREGFNNYRSVLRT